MNQDCVDGEDRSKRSDPHTALFILSKPSGPTMVGLLDEYDARIYALPVSVLTSCVSRQYLPLVYQWVLDIVSGPVSV